MHHNLIADTIRIREYGWNNHLQGKPMIKLIIVVLLFAFAAPVTSDTFPVPEVGKPPRAVAADDQFLYISGEQGVLVYSLENQERVNTIGREGMGPGEFQCPPFIQLLEDKLVLHCNMKSLIYTKTGKLVYEMKTPFPVTNLNVIGKHLVTNQLTFSPDKKTIKEFVVYDKNWKPIQSIYKKKGKHTVGDVKNLLKDYKVVPTVLNFMVQGDKIFVANGSKGFFISIYDANGKLIKNIDKKLPKVEIKENEKDRLVRLLRDRLMPDQPGFWPYYKKVAGDPKKKIPRYYPAMYDFTVSRKHLYVKTYGFREKKREEEYIVMNHCGEILRRVFLPESLPRFTAISDHTFFCIRENDEEGWYVVTKGIN